jgi:hypothetical protein
MSGLAWALFQWRCRLRHLDDHPGSRHDRVVQLESVAATPLAPTIPTRSGDVVESEAVNFAPRSAGFGRRFDSHRPYRAEIDG